jgi:hypothetical protein
MMDQQKACAVSLLGLHPYVYAISDVVRKTKVRRHGALLMELAGLNTEKKIREPKIGAATLKGSIR